MSNVKKLVWSENYEPSFYIEQNHCIAETPIGKIIVKWFEGKKNDWPVIYAPWGAYGWGGSVEDAKEEAERDYIKRIKECIDDR